MTASKRIIKKPLPHKPVVALMGHIDSPHAIARLIKQSPAHNYKAVGFEFDEKINIDEFKKFCEKEFKIGADALAKRTASMLRNNVMLSKQTLETWLNKYELDKDLIKSPEKAHAALGEAILMSVVSASYIQEYIETLKTENYSNKTIINTLEAKANSFIARAPGLHTTPGFYRYMEMVFQNLTAMQNARTQLVIVDAIQQANLTYTGIDPTRIDERRVIDKEASAQSEAKTEQVFADNIKKLTEENQGAVLFFFGLLHGANLQKLLKDWEHADEICWVIFDQFNQTSMFDPIRLDIHYRPDVLASQFPAGVSIFNCDENNFSLETLLKQKRLELLTTAIKEIIATYKLKFSTMPTDSYPQQVLAKLTNALEAKNPYKAINLILHDIAIKTNEDTNLRQPLTSLFEKLREVLWEYVRTQVRAQEAETALASAVPRIESFRLR